MSTEEEAQHQAEILMEDFKKDNPDAKHVPKVSAHYADVSSPDSVNSAISDIIRVHGKIDNLVTSAGFTENFDAINYPHDRMQKLWGVNVDGTYLFAIGVAKHLMERQSPGSLVFIGSMSGAIVNVPQAAGSIQCRQSCSEASGKLSGGGVGRSRYQGQLYISWLYAYSTVSTTFLINR